MIEAERQNADGHAGRLSHASLQQAMRAQSDAWDSLVTERCPHLFADVAVFITSAQLQQMREVIAAVERVVGLAGWKRDTPLPNPDVNTSHSTRLSKNNSQVVGYLPPAGEGTIVACPVLEDCLGVFFGYDFHLNADGAHLIEINSNAGGGFLNALLLDSQRDAALPGTAVAEKNLDRVFLDMFRNEWRLARGDAPLKNIAIVDEQPEAQYLYAEFLLAKNLFEHAGIAAHIVDPAALQARDDGLYLGTEKIDLVYNRLTDFSLQWHPTLRQAYSSGLVVLTPHPNNYAQYADKRNLARLTDAQGLRTLGVDEADIATLQAGIPHTIVVQPRHGGAEHSGAGGAAMQLLPQSAGFASNVSQLQPDMEATLWAERKRWFFKPNRGYGSKGAYRGANLTRRVFGEIMHGDYVAQKLAPPGERAVCVNDAEAVSLKYDVRCYVYDGQVQLVAARLYQGQTTNFRTPGGGFALVRVVE